MNSGGSFYRCGAIIGKALPWAHTQCPSFNAATTRKASSGDHGKVDVGEGIPSDLWALGHSTLSISTLTL